MSRIVDNLIAMKIVKMITQNFEDTEAFKLGIIDHKGNTLRKMNTLTTTQERDAYTYLNRLVFNMKKILNRLPGGENRTKSLVGALWLVKEYYENGSRTTSLMEDRYKHIMRILDNGVVLAEEQLIVSKFLTPLEESHVEFRLDHRDKVKGDHKTTFKDHEATVSDTTDKATYIKVPKYKADSFKSAMKSKHGVHAELSEEMGAGAIGGTPTNNTGGPVSVQEPKIEKKNVKKYQIMARRGSPVKC